MLIKNNYPKKIINQEIRKTQQTQNQNSGDNLINSTNNTSQRKRYIGVPYIEGTNERIQRILKPFGIILGNKSTNTLKIQLVNVKDKISKDNICNVVYQLLCQGCNVEYVGETGRNLNKRMKEHQRDIVTKKPASQVYQHVRDTQHQFDFDQCNVLHQNSNLWHRRRLEGYYTHQHTNTINRALDVHDTITPILEKTIK